MKAEAKLLKIILLTLWSLRLVKGPHAINLWSHLWFMSNNSSWQPFISVSAGKEKLLLPWQH